MYIINVTNDCDNITSSNYTDYDNITITNCTKTDTDDNIIIFKFLLLSIPSSILLFALLSLLIYTLNFQF